MGAVSAGPRAVRLAGLIPLLIRRTLPRALRGHALGVCAFEIGLFGIAAGCFLLLLARVPLFATVGPASGAILGAYLLLVILHSSALRTLRHVRTHNFHCCLTCLYPLHDDHPDAACPECGTPAYLPIAELRWRTGIDTLCPPTPTTPTSSPASAPTPPHPPDDSRDRA